MSLPTGTIEFIAFHQPALRDGEYVHESDKTPVTNASAAASRCTTKA